MCTVGKSLQKKSENRTLKHEIFCILLLGRMEEWEGWAAGVLGVSAVLWITCQSSLIWRVTNNPRNPPPPHTPLHLYKATPTRPAGISIWLPPPFLICGSRSVTNYTRCHMCREGGIGVVYDSLALRNARFLILDFRNLCDKLLKFELITHRVPQMCRRRVVWSRTYKKCPHHVTFWHFSKC